MSKQFKGIPPSGDLGGNHVLMQELGREEGAYGGAYGGWFASTCQRRRCLRCNLLRLQSNCRPRTWPHSSQSWVSGCLWQQWRSRTASRLMTQGLSRTGPGLQRHDRLPGRRSLRPRPGPAQTPVTQCIMHFVIKVIDFQFGHGFLSKDFRRKYWYYCYLPVKRLQKKILVLLSTTGTTTCQYLIVVMLSATRPQIIERHRTTHHV